MRKLSRILFLIFAATMPLAGASQTLAQRACLPPIGYRDLPYWRAEIVFAGVVESFQIDEQAVETVRQTRVSDTYTHFSNRVRFVVEKAYRGNPERKLEIISSFGFKEGERYFVYAVAGKDGRVFQLDNGECGSPPLLLERAADDVEYAEEIAAGKLGTRISGSVLEDAWRLGTARQPRPLADVEITLKNKKDTFTSRTDDKGKYIFKNIAPGEYTITAATPDGLRVKPFPEEYFYRRGLKPNVVVVGETYVGPYPTLTSVERPARYYRHSDSYIFLFSSLSSIRGKVVGHDGKILPQQYIWLIPRINGKAEPWNYIYSVWTNPADGKYGFDGIPVGEYRVVVNRNDCHSNNHPEYARNFYPGVYDENKASVVTVAENQTVRLQDFRLSEPLKERSFSGVVLGADKKPVANATVFMTPSTQSSRSDCFSVKIETVTDASGRFQLKGYNGYGYRIRAYIQPTEQSSSRSLSGTFEIKPTDTAANIELIIDEKN